MAVNVTDRRMKKEVLMYSLFGILFAIWVIGVGFLGLSLRSPMLLIIDVVVALFIFPEIPDPMESHFETWLNR